MLISINGETYQMPATPGLGASSADAAAPMTAPASAPVPHDNIAVHRLVQVLSALRLTELRIELDAGIGAIWCFQRHCAAPSFVPALLKEIRTIQRVLQDFHRDYPRDAATAARFLIWGSDTKGIFNLGGDLNYFQQLIQLRDEARLRAYALSCIDVCYVNACALNSPMVVGALVAGDALGGGLESALSCDFIIAEEQAKFGLPEIIYGLFPGMGAYSFLARRVGQAKAESFILRGDLHPAAELHALGLVDQVAPTGQGRSVMDRHLIRIGGRQFNATLAVYAARRRSMPLSYQEMADIAGDWVAVGMRLSARDMRRMQKLTAAQAHRMRGQAEAPQPPAAQ